MPTSYPLDLTGVAPSNLITGEQHSAGESNILSDNNMSTFQSFRYIVPVVAPFYGDGLVVRKIVAGVTTVLVRDVDYNLALQYQAATISIGKAVYGGILLHGSYNDTDIISIDYQVVGSPWSANRPQVLQNILDSNYNPILLSWDQVSDVQTTFPPTVHSLDINQAYGMEALLTLLNNLITTVLNKPTTPINFSIGQANGNNYANNSSDNQSIHASYPNATSPITHGYELTVGISGTNDFGGSTFTPTIAGVVQATKPIVTKQGNQLLAIKPNELPSFADLEYSLGLDSWVLKNPITKNKRIKKISSVGWNGCFVLTGGELYFTCLESNLPNQAEVFSSPFGDSLFTGIYQGLMKKWTKVILPNGSGEIVDFVTTGFNVAVLDSYGQLYTWGQNAFGQCGLGHNNIQEQPALSATGVVSIYANESGAFGLDGYNFFFKDTDGYWNTTGNNSNGQIGDNTTTNRNTWYTLTSLGTTIDKIYHSTGTLVTIYATDSTNGKLYAWGDSSWSCYGAGALQSNVPVDVSSNWGIDINNQVNDIQFGTPYNNVSCPDLTTNYTYPDTNKTSTEPVGSVVGAKTTLVSRSDGKILTIGYNTNGLCGDGTTIHRTTPYIAFDMNNAIPGVSTSSTYGDVKYFTVHGQTAYLITTNNNTLGNVWGWGLNSNYNLGTSDNANKTSITQCPNILSSKILNPNCTTPRFADKNQIFFKNFSNNNSYVLGYNDDNGYYGNGSITQSHVQSKTLELPNDEYIDQIGMINYIENSRVYIAVSNKNNLYAWGVSNANAFNYGVTDVSLSNKPILIPHPGNY